MSIFISWRGCDRTSKDKIVSEIRKMLPNELVWESDENCMTNFSKECMEAIQKCEVFVALLSEASMNMSYMLNEIIEARNLENSGKLNILVYKLSDFEYTPEFSMQLNHVPDSNYLGRLYGDDSGITTLVSRIKFLLEKRRSGMPELPFDVNVPQVEGSIFGKNRYFVSDSRNNELSKINEAFKESNVIVLSYMDGYGKKSVIKKYIETYSDNKFSVVTNVNSFNSSFKDFIINELNFTNVNNKIFENISINKLINKKIELLNKVKENTLLVISNIVFEKGDEEYLDLLDNVKCKIIFVTQIAPNYIRDKWPNVSIKQMSIDKLKELFYHFIPNIDDASKKIIDKSLETYIDNVDGHTKTIELTSKNICDDMSVASEDIIQILNELNSNKLENDLSKRIFDSISNMFDVKKFDEKEKAVILVSCYLSQLPIDEKEFVNVLKEMNLYNQDVINKLINLNWIDRDIINKKISIEKLLASVCLKKIFNQEVEYNSFKYLVDRLSDDYVNGNYNGIKLNLKRLSIYFNIKELNELTEIINLYLSEIDYRNEEISKVSINDVIQRLNIFEESSSYYFKDEEFEDLFKIVLYYLKKEFNLLLAITDYKDDKDMSNAVVSTILHDEAFSSLINEYLETFENERLKQIINDLLFNLISDENKIIYNIMVTCNEISKLDKDEYEEELVETYTILLLLLYNLIIVNKSNIYLCSKLCKKYIEIVDELETDYDYEANMSELFVITLTYFDMLIELNDTSKELDNTFEDLIYLLNTNKDKIYNKEEDYYQILASRTYYYIENLCSNNIIINNGKLDTALELMNGIPVLNDDIFNSKVYFIDKIFKYYLDNIMIDEAKTFIDKYFNEEITSYNYDNSSVIVDTLNNIISTRDTLLSPTLFDDFTDKASDYEDYYKAFHLEYNDKKSYVMYSDIANKAKTIDYNSLSNDEIKNEIKKLKMQATMGMKWDTIAPKAFAIVSEVGYRILGYRHHLVQYIGACMMLDGKVAEIYNGEGKTYTIILVAFVKSLYNKKVRIIDSNEYLVKRNYTWMKGVLEELGLKVGLLTLSTIRNDISSYDVIYEEILSGMYKRIATEFSFKNNEKYDVAIVDEADLTIVEYASKPMYKTTNKVDEKYKVLCESLHSIYKKICNSNSKEKYWSFKNGRVTLKKELLDYVSREFNATLTDMDQKDVNKIQEIFVACIETYEIFKVNVNYYVVNNNIMVENKVTGKLLDVNPLYKFMIAKKEGLEQICESIKFTDTTIDNFITVYEYINDFDFVCGTTATASSMEHEFKKLYNLNVMRVPTNIPIKRTDNKPLVFYDFNAKMKHIINLIEEKHEKKQPVLLLSNSISESVNVSKILKDKGINHLLINGANIDKEAHLFNESGKLGMVTVSTSISNRGVDIVLGGNFTEIIKEMLISKGYSKENVDKAIYEINVDNPIIQEIKEKYNALYSLYKKNAIIEREQILEVGGLCVIGTSCFEDLRIEQQLRGRAGRQGQVGESYVFYSFKDPNFQKLLGSSANFLDKMISSLGDEAIDSKLLNSTVERSRRILQNRIYESVSNKDEIIYYENYRKKLIEFKNKVLNKQITFNDIINEHFINSKLVLKDINDHIKENKPLKNYLSVSVGKDIKKFANLKEKLIVKELDNFMKSYLSSYPDSIYHICNENIEQLFNILEFIIGMIWKNYIKKMTIEIDKYKNNQLVNQNKKRKILNNVSKELFENEFHEMICMFIFSKIRKQ